MDPAARARFNRDYRPEKYSAFIELLNRRCGTEVPFRNCETPCFFPTEVIQRLTEAGADLALQLVNNQEYLRRSDVAVPAEFNFAGEDAHPLFLCADFGLTHDHQPKLVEIQGFPSLYAYQPVLAETYRDAYGIEGGRSLLVDDYWKLLRSAIVGEHDPDDVALVETDPYHQKTLCDFLLTRERLGIRIVDIAGIEKRGRKLFAGGRPIERIYNRAIVDELVRKQVRLQFDPRGEVDVEWAGHPNWYFRISKFSIPFLDHPSVPKTLFLDQITELPDDLENWVLKPLYSFAGIGVKVGPAREDVDAIQDRAGYILQERIDFAPVIATPHGATKAEIRIMYIWTDERPVAVTTIVRMGRGKMMGVDHNKNLEWVGASAGFIV